MFGKCAGARGMWMAVLLGAAVAAGWAPDAAAVPACPAINTIDAQGGTLYLGFGKLWGTEDLDGNGMLDSWEAALVAEVLCTSSHPLYGAVRSAHDGLVNNIKTDVALRGFPGLYDGVADAAAALMIVSWNLTNAMVDRLDLTAGFYAPYIHGSGAVPFSRDADLDLDTYTNKQEYDAVVGVFGSRGQYVQAAMTSPVPPNPVPGSVPACPAINTIDEAGAALYFAAGKNWLTDDRDDNGIIDSWEVAVLAELLCRPEHPLHNEVKAAYTGTLDVMRREPNYYLYNLAPVDHAVAALMLVSGGFTGLIASSVNLTPGLYVPYTHLSGAQPFSATADIDGDTLNNRAEYDQVLGLFGTRADYVAAALTPQRPPGMIVDAAESIKYLYELQISIPLVDPVCLLCEDIYTADLDMNGIPDYGHGWLLDAFLFFADTPNFATVAGSYAINHLLVKDYLEQLWDALSLEYGVPVDTLIGLLVDTGKVERALTALVTFGEPAGVAGMVAIMGEYGIEVDASQFNQDGAPFVGAAGDADGDGVCNLNEYNATEQGTLAAFIAFAGNALNASVTLNGGGCDGEENNNGEEPATCPVLAEIDAQGELLYGALGSWDETDYNENGMIDSWEVALLAELLCRPEHPDYLGARKKFTGNLYRLRADAQHANIQPAETLLTALMTTSATFVSTFASLANLSGFYYPYRVDDIEVAGGGGDPDGDTLTNKVEYLRVVAQGGTREDYIAAALTPFGGANVDRCVDQCAPAGGCANEDFDGHMRAAEKAAVDFGLDLGGYTFDPGVADINGGFNLETEEVFPNGLLDSDEFALLNYFLTHPAHPLSATVCAAWSQNIARMTTDTGGNGGLVNQIAPTLKYVLAAYMTLGEPGSYEIPITALTLAAQAPIPLGISTPSLGNYSLLPHILGPQADPDGDGFSNAEEYACFRNRSRCCFLLAAASADIYPGEGQCLEDIGEGEEGEAEGAAEGELEGEGEGDPVDDCDFVTAIAAEGAALYSALALDWATSDLDGNGMADSWEAALVAHLLCAATGPVDFAVPAGLAEAAGAAAVANLTTLSGEPRFNPTLAPYGQAIAALLTVGPGMAASMDAVLQLTGTYAPLEIAGVWPLSASGNPDGDAGDNRAEYDWARAQSPSATPRDYVVATLDPDLGPEGEVEPTCGAVCEVACDSAGIEAGFEPALAALLDVLATLEPESAVAPELADLDGNGLPDLAHARLLDSVLRETAAPSHCCVRLVWDTNAAVTVALMEEFVAHPLWGLLVALSGSNSESLQATLAVSITGLMTLGEAATQALIADALNGIDVNPPLPAINLSDFDRSAEVFLAVYGDADGDAACNLGEFRAQAAGPEDWDAFVASAIDPLTTGDGGGCPPCGDAEGEMEGEGEGTAEGDGEPEGVSEGEGEGEGFGEGEGEGQPEGGIEGEGGGEGEGEAEGEAEGGGEGEPLPEGEALPCGFVDPESAPLAVPSFVEQSLSIHIEDARTIDHLSVWLDVSHPRVGDLSIWLRAPSGDTVFLLSQPAVDGADLAGTRFDDRASLTLESGTAPFAGPHRPASALSVLAGQPVQGTWQLTVYDGVAGMDGTLHAWALAFNGECDTLPEGERHSVDSNGDWAVSLSELLRVIQLYNSGAYHVQAGTEDGYAPGAGSQDGAPHSSDYNPQDWRITLSELLRVIQFYNSPGGRYSPDPGSEDGYRPGA